MTADCIFYDWSCADNYKHCLQVASVSQAAAELEWQADAPASPDVDRRADWPAGPMHHLPHATDHQPTSQSSPQASDAQLSSSFPPRLPGLLTSHDRSGSEELAFQGADSSRASSRIPAHSALSRMLQESSGHEAGSEEDQAAAWCTAPDTLQQGMLHEVDGHHLRACFVKVADKATVTAMLHAHLVCGGPPIHCYKAAWLHGKQHYKSCPNFMDADPASMNAHFFLG